MLRGIYLKCLQPSSLVIASRGVSSVVWPTYKYDLCLEGKKVLSCLQNGLEPSVVRKLLPHFERGGLRDASQVKEWVMCESFTREELPLDDLLSLANYLSSTASQEAFQLTVDTLQKKFPRDFKKQAELQHLYAQLEWAKGNIGTSFEMFMVVYEHNESVRRDVTLMLQRLIGDSMMSCGRAVAHVITRYSHTFWAQNKCLSLLHTVWFSLFLSESFEEQCSASQLLLDVHQLQNHLSEKLPSIINSFFHQNDTEKVHRLIQDLLLCDMMEDVGNVIRALFDYYYKRGYAKGCDAVVSCCDALKLSLTYDQKLKYSHLVKKTREIKLENLLYIPPSKAFQFKF